jgi:hypothetical protein
VVASKPQNAPTGFVAPRLKVGSILRRAEDGRRFVVKSIRCVTVPYIMVPVEIRKADEPPPPLKSRRRPPRRKPRHHTGFSFVLEHGSPYFPET